MPRTAWMPDTENAWPLTEDDGHPFLGDAEEFCELVDEWEDVVGIETIAGEDAVKVYFRDDAQGEYMIRYIPAT